LEITLPGFAFSHRLTGAPPTIRRYLRSETTIIVVGDVVTLASGRAVLSATGDTAFLGVAVAGRDVAPAAYLEVVTDEDAVYAVADRERRLAGDSLDLRGASGRQCCGEGPNEDFEVVVDSTADEETLLRITLRKRHAFAVHAALLSPARERQLVLAAASGDAAAAAELVDAFMPAVYGIARRYRFAQAVSGAELVQEGVVGLLRAVKRFDPAATTPFWAYASWWVRQAMQQLVSEVARPTVLSDRAQRALAYVRELRRAHLQEHGRDPSIEELVAASGLNRGQVESVLAVELVPRGLGEAIDVGDGASGTLGEQIPDPVAGDAYDAVIDQLVTEQVTELTSVLDERERSILYAHYGVGEDPQSLRELGAALGMSAERVRQIEERALRKLRAEAS
jgi:RNA polymerase sigma factor (sigma-70 family)